MNTPKVLQQNLKLKNLFLILFFIITSALNLSAQNITDFKIFIPADTTSQLKFHDKVSGWEFSEENGFLNYDISLADDYSMKLTAKQATAEIMHLLVTEGKRTHKFTLLYQEGINGLELTHDYSDLAQLAKLIKDNKEGKNQDQKSVSLLSEADKALENGQPETAKQKYEEILQADAGNSYAKKQLAVVNEMLNEKAKAAQKITEDAFKAAIQKASNALIAKKYEDALTAYLEAQKLNPEDEYVRSQVILMNKKMEEEKLVETNRKKDSIYSTNIIAAGKALYNNLFEEALSKYNQALIVKPGDAIATAGIRKTEETKAGFEQKQENEKNEGLYRSYIDAADKAYLDKFYEEAKLAYMKALNVKAQDKYAFDQLHKIEKESEAAKAEKMRVQINKTTAEQHDAMIRFADSAFNNQMWDAAKNEYEKALQLIDKPYTRQQIAAANQKINELNKVQLAINEQLKKDSVANEKYKIIIAQADSNFQLQQYSAARDQYRKALAVKADQHAEERLAETEKILTDIAAKSQAAKESIAKEKETVKKYNLLIAKAKIAYINNEYTNAQQVYTEASELRPDEEEPKRMLADINNKLSSMMQAKDRQDKYDSLTAKADLAIANNDYITALEGYRQALTVKPDEAYFLQKQITYLQRQLAVKDSITVEEKKAEDRRHRFKEGMDAYNKGRNFLKEMKYEPALSEFQKFLHLIPDTLGLNTNQYNQQGLIDFAKLKVKDLQDYIATQRIKDSADKAGSIIEKPAAADTANQKSSGFIKFTPQQQKIKNRCNAENKVQNFYSGSICRMKEQEVYLTKNNTAVARLKPLFNLSKNSIYMPAFRRVPAS